MLHVFILVAILAFAGEWLTEENLQQQNEVFMLVQAFIGVDVSRIFRPTAVELSGIMATLLSYVSVHYQIVSIFSAMLIHTGIHMCIL